MIKWRFSAAASALQTIVGDKQADGIAIDAATGVALFGPYIELPSGACAARLFLDGPATGRVVMDIASGCGETIHASREVDLTELSSPVIELKADIAAPVSGFEVRLQCADPVRAKIVRVAVDLAPDRDERPRPDRPVGGETRKTYAAKIESGFWDKYLSGDAVLEIGYKGYGDPTVPVVPQAIGIDVGYPGYDGGRLPFADASVDAIYSSHCFEHISDYVTVLRDWYRLLKIGGYMVTVVPHQYLFERRHALPSLCNDDHKRFFTPDSLLLDLKEALPENGYRIRHLRENDEGFDYSVPPMASGGGLYEIEIVVEKIRKPNWNLDDGSVRIYSAGEFQSGDDQSDPFVISLDLQAAQGFVVWGPYAPLWPAHYEAEFRFEATGFADGPLSAPIGFDVAMDREQIASGLIEGAAGRAALDSGCFVLPFASPSEKRGVYEFRVGLPGGPLDGRIAFKGVILRYARD